jgi:putative ABC transport system permease protein
MEIRPILASLHKHRIPAVLIVLQIALACAVLCNAVFMISKRVSDMRLPNAMEESSVVVVNVQGADEKLAAADIPRNLAALHGIAGVEAVSVVHTMPLSRNNWGWSFGLVPDAPFSDPNNLNVTLYFVGSGADAAMGLRLRQGRFFSADEYADSKVADGSMPSTHVMVVTETLAKKLWPGQSALGKTVYSKPNYFTVVGVVADVLRPYTYGLDRDRSYYDIFLPVAPDAVLHEYVLRGAPADRDRIAREAQATLQALNPQSVVEGQTYQSIRDAYFANSQSMVWILVLVCIVMLAVTAFGIVGLTSFWVGQRRRQIGIRRAVGATRGDILRYFRTENFLLSSAGVLFGMVLAFGINLYLMQHYELERMPWYYLPAGALALWLIGQLAVQGPAMRAASVPPVVATQPV